MADAPASLEFGIRVGFLWAWRCPAQPLRAQPSGPASAPRHSVAVHPRHAMADARPGLAKARRLCEASRGSTVDGVAENPTHDREAGRTNDSFANPRRIGPPRPCRGENAMFSATLREAKRTEAAGGLT